MSLSAIKSGVAVHLNNYLLPHRQKVLQSKKLGELVRYAYTHVDFYRERWDRAGVKPETIQSTLDLEKLPIIRRDDIQRTSSAKLVSKKRVPDDLVTRSTGGATGKPVTVYSSRQALEHETVVWLRSWAKCGLRTIDRQATIRDLDIDVHYVDKPQWFQRLGFFRIQYLDLYEQPADLIRKLAQARPHILRGPPSILEVIAKQ